MNQRLFVASGLVLCAIAVILLFGINEAKVAEIAGRNIQRQTLPTLRALEHMRYGIIRVVASTSEIAMLHLVGNERSDAASEMELIREGETAFRDALAQVRAQDLQISAEDIAVWQTIDRSFEALLGQSAEVVRLARARKAGKELAEAKEIFEEREQTALAAIEAALGLAQAEADQSFLNLSADIAHMRIVQIYLGGIALLMLVWYLSFVVRLLRREAEARRKAERLSEQLGQEFAARKRMETLLVAHQKMEALGTLIGGIAHSINNYLSPIVTLSKLLGQDLAGSKHAEDVGRIHQAGVKASLMLKDVLKFSRSNQPSDGTCDLTASLDASLAILRASLPNTVRIDQALRLPQARVPLDEAAVDSIIFNLIGNAVDALPDNSGLIRVELDAVAVADGLSEERTVRLDNGRYARLRIEDDGHGIAADILPHIFEPFFTTKAVGQGTGLGLSVAYDCLTKAKGDIMVDSTLGQGTRFELFFPLLPPAAHANNAV